MFALSESGAKYVRKNRVEDECTACLTVLTVYGLEIGIGAVAGAIGQSLLANPNLAAQISYQTAVQAGALGATTGLPPASLLKLCLFGGNDNSTTDTGCVALLNNFLASDIKSNCFLPESIAYGIEATLKSGGFGALYFVAGAGIKGALISPQAIAQAAAIGGLGNLILGGGISLLFVAYNTRKNGKVDWCTPAITFADCDECAKISLPSLPAWKGFRGAPKAQEEMQRDADTPVAVVVEPNSPGDGGSSQQLPVAVESTLKASANESRLRIDIVI